MRSTMSILGLYQWDETIFENMVLPEGVNPETAVNTIVYDNAELEIMYPDPDAMKVLIGIWSSKELDVWSRVYKAITEEYDPLENYNRTEVVNQKDVGSLTAEGSSKNNHKVTGYNDGVLVDQNQDIGSSNSKGNSTLDTQRTSNIKGNIGVTTSQQMLNQELDLAPRTNIYQYISDSFKNRFCLMVY